MTDAHSAVGEADQVERMVEPLRRITRLEALRAGEEMEVLGRYPGGARVQARGVPASVPGVETE